MDLQTLARMKIDNNYENFRIITQQIEITSKVENTTMNVI